MRYSGNPEGISSNHEGQVVGKNPQIDLPTSVGPNPVEIRVSRNPRHTTIYFHFQPVPESDARFFVVGDCVKEFVLRFFDEVDVHARRRVSAVFLTSS